MASEITLFDLPSKPTNKCWSGNAWKTRLVLNYKSIPYTTEWLEFPDIAPHHKALSIPPNPENPNLPKDFPSAYTIPTVHFLKDGTYIQDSGAIARELEKRYPSPSLHLDIPQQAAIEALWSKMIPSLFPAITPKLVADLLTERSAAYVVETRERALNVKISDWEKIDANTVWAEAAPALTEFGDVLREKGGPFVLGAEPSYADFMVVAGMQFMKAVSEGTFERFVGADEALGRLYEASKQWVEKDT
ncbi:MAG: hypothetical protein LQ341_007559 [Variospora aurantia]|nr:MAG: hypothetical protein LQ341_007559 [Variospora aurantia]